MKRPSPALVVAVIALVFAATGTGWAVTQLPRNSVGTKQLKNGAVVSSKVKDGSLRSTDFAAGQLPAGATGARGPSDAWSYRATNVALTQTDAAVVTSATLPAGSYTAIGTVAVDNTGNSVSTGAVCALTTDSYDISHLNVGDKVPVPLVGAVTLTAPATIAITCRRKDATAITVDAAALVITRVETLTTG